MDEILCDGLMPLYDSATGNPFTCMAAPDCPPGSYCHEQFGQCCSEGGWVRDGRLMFARSY